MENFKKERYNRQIELSRTKSTGARGEGNTAEETAVERHKPEEFLQDVREFELHLQDCGRTIRLEHLGKDPKDAEADRVRQERAAQREWEEAEERKQRKKEQMARDPHRKIQLRLENKRRFEMDTLDKAGIPMQTIDFGGGGNRQAISMVDLRQLQRKCQGLNEPGGVRAMLELQEHREKVTKMYAERTLQTTIKMSTSEPSLIAGGSEAELDRTTSVLSTSWDKRLPVVLDKKGAIHQDKLERHLDNFRQPAPKWFPHELLGGSQNNRGLRASIKHVMNLNRVVRHKHIAGLEDILVDTEGKITFAATGEEFHSKIENETPARPAAPPEVVAEAQRCWRKVRGIVNIFMVWVRHNRQKKSILAVQAILNQMSEWARIRRAMTKLLSNVKLLQRSCREWLVTRDKRCALMMKDWQKVEDTYLQAYFKIYAVKIMEEHAAKVEQDCLGGLSAWAKAHPEQSTAFKKSRGKHAIPPKFTREETEGLLSAVLNWKDFRIPAQHRKAVVIRYYMIQLMKRVRNEEAVNKSVISAIRCQKELIDYLKTFGAEHLELDGPSQAGLLADGTERKPEQRQDFWYFPEPVILDAICVSAQALKNMGGVFNEHPGTKAQVLPEECFDRFCRPTRLLNKDARKALTAEIQGTWLNNANSGLRRRSAFGGPHEDLSKMQPMKIEEETEDQDHDNEKKVKFSGTNIDDVFQSFTPRLGLFSVSEPDDKQKKEEEDSTLWPAVPELRIHS